MNTETKQQPAGRTQAQIQAEIIETVINALPDPLIKNIDLSRADCVYFDWHGRRYKVAVYGAGEHLCVDRVEGSMLAAGPDATLMGHILRKYKNERTTI